MELPHGPNVYQGQPECRCSCSLGAHTHIGSFMGRGPSVKPRLRSGAYWGPHERWGTRGRTRDTAGSLQPPPPVTATTANRLHVWVYRLLWESNYNGRRICMYTMCACLEFDFLNNPSSDRLHTWQVYCQRP